MLNSATVTLTRVISVAEGVFAPGHLGELTQVIPFELVDAVLEETGAVQQRLRDLPSRVGVYLLLAMGLFEQVGLAAVWSKLVAGLGGLPVTVPSEKALRDLRRRIGPAPVKALFEVLAGPLAQPRTPGVRYRGMRTVAFDGCSSLKVPDSARNRWRFGKVKYRMGFAGYPALMLMALVETGTDSGPGCLKPVPSQLLFGWFGPARQILKMGSLRPSGYVSSAPPDAVGPWVIPVTAVEPRSSSDPKRSRFRSPRTSRTTSKR